MTHKIVLRPSITRRRQPLLSNQSPSVSSRFAEVAGGTTAECAAVCCCCPCGIVNLLYLAVYKLPAGLCRKALKNKRLRRLKQNELITTTTSTTKHRRCKCGCVETELQIHPVSVDAWRTTMIGKSDSDLLDKEVEDLEKEMWERFYNTGFWRSPSQRDG